MNAEVHIVPIGPNSWAVTVGGTRYQAFDSKEKALAFGKTMAAKSNTDCKIIMHDHQGNEQVVDRLSTDRLVDRPNETRH